MSEALYRIAEQVSQRTANRQFEVVMQKRKISWIATNRPRMLTLSLSSKGEYMIGGQIKDFQGAVETITLWIEKNMEEKQK